MFHFWEIIAISYLQTKFLSTIIGYHIHVFIFQQAKYILFQFSDVDRTFKMFTNNF